MALEETDLYALLGLEKGVESTEQEIKKGYRKKALELHPDKRPGDKNAAAEFDQLQKAYEVLVDEKARKAYDAVLRVQKERVVRDRQRSDKRQRMVDELTAREKAFARDAVEEQAAKERLKFEIERLRKEAAKKREADLRARMGVPQRDEEPAPTEPSAVDKNRTLKVSWSRGEEDVSDGYTAEELQTIFSACGPVEDVVIRSRKKRKGLAFVVMASLEAAKEATQRALGDSSNPILAVPLNPLAFDIPPPFSPIPSSTAGPPGRAGPPPGPGAASAAPGPGSFGAGLAGEGPGPATARPGPTAGPGVPPGSTGFAARPTVGAGFRDYENQTLMKMRKAAEERARLIREMEEQDKREAEQAEGEKVH